jgi:hypothetical protein
MPQDPSAEKRSLRGAGFQRLYAQGFLCVSFFPGKHDYFSVFHTVFCQFADSFDRSYGIHSCGDRRFQASAMMDP